MIWGVFKSQAAAFKSASFTLKQPFHYVLGVLPQKGVEETQLISMTSGIGLGVSNSRNCLEDHYFSVYLYINFSKLLIFLFMGVLLFYFIHLMFYFPCKKRHHEHLELLQKSLAEK